MAVVPERFDRVLNPGETIRTSFNIFSKLGTSGLSEGTLEASIVGGGSIVRLGQLTSYTEETQPLTPEEIEQLPPDLQDKVTEAVVQTVFAQVGPGDFSEKSLSLPVPQGGGVNGELFFVAPETSPPNFSAKLVIGGSTVPINLMFGAFQFEFPTSPIVAHQGQEVGVPVSVTLPAASPAAQIVFELLGSGLDIPPQKVSVPSGGSTSATLRLLASSDAPLGTLTIDLLWRGLEPLAMESGAIPLRITVEPFSQKLVASMEIRAAAAILGQGPPGPRSPVSDVEDAGNGGFVQRYSTGVGLGNLYWHPHTGAGARWVYGAILQKYLALGGPRSSLGYPITDERPTSDGRGRFNHFRAVQLPDKPESSIFWTQKTDAHAVSGAIRRRWAELGFEQSFLGYPTADEVDFPPGLPPPEGGRMVPFEGGAIYWWPDTGAIELNDVVVRYTGLHCFGETDFDQPGGLGGGSDEPYVVVVVVHPDLRPDEEPPAHVSQIYEDVDRGESRPDLLEIYRGKPGGLTLAAVLIEHDTGHPDTYKVQIQAAVAKAVPAVTAIIAFIPVFGPVLAAIAGPILQVAAPVIGAEINRLADFGDDVIGVQPLALSAKEMVVLAARTSDSNFNNIGFKRETELISGDGASYKVYFSLVPA